MDKRGINVGSVIDFDTYWVFADLLRNAVWLTDFADRNSHDITKCPSDQIAGSKGLTYFRAGLTDIFKLRIRKKSDYSQAGVANVTVNGATGSPFTADTDIQFSATNTSQTVTINTIDADTVVEIWSPGTAPSGTPGVSDLFHPDYLNHLKRFEIIRLLSWLPINRSATDVVIDGVEDLVSASNSGQASPQFGAALEHGLELCRQAKADAWIPFPHNANNALIDQWASLIDTWLTANTTLKVYIEYSNELWNTGFQQAKDMHASDSTIRAQEAGRRSALLMKRVDLTTTNYFKVLAWQAASGSSLRDEVYNSFVTEYGSDPDKFAIAPYGTWPLPERNTIISTQEGVTGVGTVATDATLAATWTPEKMIDNLRTSLTAGVELTKTWTEANKTFTDSKGIDLIAYEGGHHLQPDAANAITYPQWADNFLEAQRHTKMEDLTRELDRAWIEKGGKEICYLSFIQEATGTRVFGHLDTMFPVNSDYPKWRALVGIVDGVTGTADNPYTLTFNGLWSLIESCPELTSLVKLGNRIKYNQNVLDPEKEHVQHADLPELVLMCTSFQNFYHFDCDTRRILSRWEFLISSGSYRARHDYLKLKWILDIILTAYCEVGQLTSIQYNGKPFVKTAKIASDIIGLDVDEQNRNIKGWTSITAIDVDMYLSV